MKIIPGKEEEYRGWYNNNNLDPYGHGVFTFLERWAALMEEAIEKSGNPEEAIEKYANSLSHVADTEGITGFMYGVAVEILSKEWVYGETLRKWHNKKYGHEGDGCVNPAIWTIETKE